MIRKNFQIGSFEFTIEVPDEMKIPAHFRIFEMKSKPEGMYSHNASEYYKYRMKIVDALPVPLGQVKVQREDLSVYLHQNREEREIGVKGESASYALYRELSEYEAEIYIDRKFLSLLQVDPAFVSLFALEKRLLSYGEMVLHCAYMELNGMAVLFSAPSGTGKTTQAALWERYRGTRVINGDRAVLSRTGGSWKAKGWPVCGTSDICHNEEMPVRTIVMLSQAKENSIQKFGPGEAFMQLFPQVTVNIWDRECVNLVGDLLEQVVYDIPVLHLSCNMEEQAVLVLEKALGEYCGRRTEEFEGI